MKNHIKIAIAAVLVCSSVITLAESPEKPKGPPPSGAKGGAGSQESTEMQALLKSFNLSSDQQTQYAEARAATGKAMRDIHTGKVSGKLSQDEVLKLALASHKAFNARVKEILSPEQYAKWEPLREADHHKIAAAHKKRDEEAAKKTESAK